MKAISIVMFTKVISVVLIYSKVILMVIVIIQNLISIGSFLTIIIDSHAQAM